VARVLRDGSGAYEQLETEQQSVEGLALGATHLYWTNAGSDGAVRKRNLTTGAADIIVSGINEPRALAVADGFIVVALFGSGEILRLAE
jgi:hypothetical protein